uniref:Uncharacterized protein n=1 Tax=Arundo donax TaxID=35708 RepID=A0A0A9A7L7_ARUDO
MVFKATRFVTSKHLVFQNQSIFHFVKPWFFFQNNKEDCIQTGPWAYKSENHGKHTK